MQNDKLTPEEEIRAILEAHEVEDVVIVRILKIINELPNKKEFRIAKEWLEFTYPYPYTHP